MGTVLPRLRDDLDAVPSPLPDHPGLLLRDPLRYSDAAIVVPPLLVRCLSCFDGAHTDADLDAMLVQLTGQNDGGRAAAALNRALSEGGFLRDTAFRILRANRRREFAESPVRDAAFSGGGYPADKLTLGRTLETWTGATTPRTTNGGGDRSLGSPPSSSVFAIAAPHVSPSGGVSSYAAAYQALGPELAERTFVILGTSHYGRPNRFGVTRKSFQTPLGTATTDVALVDQLTQAAPDAIDLEDYCHSVEHSIEFQVLFLQNLFGAAVRILPILCGPFGRTVDAPGATRPHRPEDDAAVARMLGALGELQAAHEPRLAWVLGVDMAHVGRRYGDSWEARAHQGAMNEVAARDAARLERVVAGDADGFWQLLNERGHDDLKWCGAAPLYTFLRAHPGRTGQLLRYDQWNIDEQSVVSFAALAFHA